jgi:hypothetical protein
MSYLQHCNSYGDLLSDEKSQSKIILPIDYLFRHKCLLRQKKTVIYFKTIIDSIAWGVYNDDDDVTRCLKCDKMWKIKIEASPFPYNNM